MGIIKKNAKKIAATKDERTTEELISTENSTNENTEHTAPNFFKNKRAADEKTDAPDEKKGSKKK